MSTLERVYGTPVDIEYAVNMDEDGEFVVNLLQCRPLYLGGEGEEVHVEDLSLRKVLFDVRGASMGTSKKRKIDVVVQIDAKLYHEMPYAQKYKAANAVGRINRYYADTGRNLLLMTPGRIGTSSPELGVPVSFADISCFGVICEVSDSQAGFMPELSYGSHMFQDMVGSVCSSGCGGPFRADLPRYGRTFRDDLGQGAGEPLLLAGFRREPRGLWGCVSGRPLG